MRGRTVFWILVAVGIAVVLATVGALPPVIATHFDAAGRPNGWSAPWGYAVFLALFGVGLPLGMVATVSAFARRAPPWINLPHRDLWLAEPHRAEGLAQVRGHMWWLACVLVTSALVMHGAIVYANASDPPRLPLAAAVGSIGLILAGIAA